MDQASPAPQTRAGRAWVVRATVRVLARPALWPTAVRQVFVLAPTGWWHAWPPLPTPDRAYLRFRLQTQYGDPDHVPEPEDVIAYLHWCRQYRRAVR